MSGTSGDDLYRAMMRSRAKGTFIIRQKDNFKQSDYKEPMIGIVNLQSSTQGNGTHWTAFYIPPRYNKKINGIEPTNKNYYFDSYGAPPPESIVKFLKTKGRSIVYNDQQLQKLRTDTCGEYVIAWIRHMLIQNTAKSDKWMEQKYLDFIYNIMNPKDLDANEAYVMKKVKIRGKY